MLQNASLLAIVAVHTAENEPSKLGDGARPETQTNIRRRAGRADARHRDA